MITQLSKVRAEVQTEIDALTLPRGFPYRVALAANTDAPDILALTNQWSVGQGNLCGWEDLASGKRSLYTSLDSWLALTVRDSRNNLVLFAARGVREPPTYQLQALIHAAPFDLLALSTQSVPVYRALTRLGYTHMNIRALHPNVQWVADIIEPMLPISRAAFGRNVKGGPVPEAVTMAIKPALIVMERCLAAWRP